MLKWDSRDKNIGNVKARSRKIITFTLIEGELPDNIILAAECNCTTPSYNKDKKILTVKYKAPSFPNQIVDTQMFTRKSIFIYDGETKQGIDILTFQATITK